MQQQMAHSASVSNPSSGVEYIDVSVNTPHGYDGVVDQDSICPKTVDHEGKRFTNDVQSVCHELCHTENNRYHEFQ